MRVIFFGSVLAFKYLLIAFSQAGKQLEHMTGGLIKAGYHEVVVNDATLAVRRRFYLSCSTS